MFVKAFSRPNVGFRELTTTVPSDPTVTAGSVPPSGRSSGVLVKLGSAALATPKGDAREAITRTGTQRYNVIDTSALAPRSGSVRFPYPAPRTPRRGPLVPAPP